MKEQIMKEQLRKVQIRKMFNKTNPPQEMRDRIYEEIIQKAETNPHRRTKMGKQFLARKICIAAIMAVVLVGSGSVYAAVKYRNAGETAQELGDKKLAEAFGKQENEIVIGEAGNYRVAYLGVVSGRDISDSAIGAGTEKDKTYAAVAVERRDGTEMTGEDSIMVSPLIEGQKPWQVNIATLNGNAVYNIVDGVEYRIIEIDNIEIFADRKLYLAVTDNEFSFKECYNYDEASGAISRNEAYSGLNLLFTINADAGKADPAAAKAYLNELFGGME